ncbi:flavodoxin [Cellulomonas endophytica]|uniref:flavodoxin n=1 Tax=Cellulomonas endophytica TaxID=2494735 RepID=UPI00196B5A2F|nr:flavodoxin [Cellulomonas endophytica]
MTLPEPRSSDRRAVLRAALLLGAGALGAALTACSTPQASTSARRTSPAPDPSTAPGATTTAPSTAGGSRTLLVYFSRAGENYFHGGRTHLTVGNTEVLADMIAEAIRCDVHRIEPVEAYPDSYDATVARNVQEQDDDARPAVANPLTSLQGYDTILLGSPIWNVRPPMIMATVAEALDFTGTSVHPFVTYAVSGLGRTERDYTAWCAGARLGEGFAARGEDVPDPRSSVRADAQEWLRAIGLLTA